jgi:hypothetical protein
MLKLEITFITKVIPRLGQLDSHDILDPDSKFTVGVVSWFVGNDMSSLECCVVVMGFWTYSLWSLVNIEERADTMTGTMSIIQSVGPQKLPCEWIKDVACWSA